MIAKALEKNETHDWSKLTTTDHRKAIKLKGLRSLGVAYHFDPFLPIKRSLFSKKYAVKDFSYRKAIKPHDVAAARARLEHKVGRAVTS